MNTSQKKSKVDNDLKVQHSELLSITLAIIYQM